MPKTVGRITYIPIESMTADDWEWLDFDNTRMVAQVRIAAEILAGRLEGFIDVRLLEKAAKNRYLWPANAEAIAQLQDNDWNAFGQVAELDEYASVTDKLNALRSSFAFLLPVALAAILAHLGTRLDQARAGRVSKIDLDTLTTNDVELLMSTITMWHYEYEEALALLEDLPDSDEKSELEDYLRLS